MKIIAPRRSRLWDLKCIRELGTTGPDVFCVEFDQCGYGPSLKPYLRNDYPVDGKHNTGLIQKPIKLMSNMSELKNL